MFATKASQKALSDVVIQLAKSTGFILIEGPSGCGKTHLVSPLTEQLKDSYRIVRLPYSRLSFDELLKCLAHELKLNCDSEDNRSIYKALHTFAHRCQVERQPLLLIIDDAQYLTDDALNGLHRTLSSTTAERIPLRGILLAEQGFGAQLKLKQPDEKLVTCIMPLGLPTEAEMTAFVQHLLQQRATDLELSEAATQALVMDAAGSYRTARQRLNMAIIEARAAGIKLIEPALIDTIRNNHGIGSDHSLFAADAEEQSPGSRREPRPLSREGSSLPPELEGILLHSLTDTPDKPRLKGSSANAHQPLFINDLESPSVPPPSQSPSDQSATDTTAPVSTDGPGEAPLASPPPPPGQTPLTGNRRQPPAQQEKSHHLILAACIFFALLAAGLFGAQYMGVDLKALAKQVQQNVLQMTGQQPATPPDSDQTPDVQQSIIQPAATPSTATQATSTQPTAAQPATTQQSPPVPQASPSDSPEATALTWPSPPPAPTEQATDSASPARQSPAQDASPLEDASGVQNQSETENRSPIQQTAAPMTGAAIQQPSTPASSNTTISKPATSTTTTSKTAAATTVAAEQLTAPVAPVAAETQQAANTASAAAPTALSAASDAVEQAATAAGTNNDPDRFQQEADAAQIRLLLKQADIHRKAFRFTIPQERNAVVSYRKVLQLDADNPAAKEGLEWIRQRYYARAEAAIAAGNWGAAAQNYARLLWMNPEDKTAQQGAETVKQRLANNGNTD